MIDTDENRYRSAHSARFGRVKSLDGKVRLLINGWSSEAEKEVAAGGFDRLEFHGGDFGDFGFLVPHKSQIKALAIFSGIWSSAAQLEELAALRSLSIGPALKGLDFSLLSQLERLNIDGWVPRYARTLFECPTLKSLRIEGYDGADCMRFGELAQLTRLTLAKGKLASLSGLARCRNLESIEFAYLRKLTDIAEIENIDALRELELGEGLPALRDLRTVFAKTQLRRLSLHALDVVWPDVAWLKTFTRLHVLGIRNVEPQDWDALFASPELKKLVVTFTKSTGLSLDQVGEIARAHGLQPTQITAMGIPAKQKGYLLEFRPDGSTQNLWSWREQRE